MSKILKTKSELEAIVLKELHKLPAGDSLTDVGIVAQVGERSGRSWTVTALYANDAPDDAEEFLVLALNKVLPRLQARYDIVL
jgi:hypothetical protein